MVPEEMLLGQIESRLRQSPAPIRIEGFRKGLFFNVSASALVVEMGYGASLRAEDLKARLSIPWLMELALVFPIEGSVGSGKMNGQARITRAAQEIRLDIKSAEIAKLGLPDTVQGTGSIDAELMLVNGKGTLKLTSDPLALGTTYIAGLPIPLGLFRAGRGMARIEGGSYTIESLALEGDGVYARATGTIRGTKADLLIEIMPSAETMRLEPSILMLSQYEKAKGYYRIPVKLDLGNIK